MKLAIKIVVVLIILDPVLGAVASLTVPALVYAARRYATRVISLSFDVQQRLAELSGVVEEAIGGIQVIKSYGQEAQEQAKLDDSAERIFDRATRLARIRSRYAPAFEIIPSAATVRISSRSPNNCSQMWRARRVWNLLVVMMSFVIPLSMISGPTALASLMVS